MLYIWVVKYTKKPLIQGYVQKVGMIITSLKVPVLVKCDTCHIKRETYSRAMFGETVENHNCNGSHWKTVQNIHNYM